MRLKQDFLIIFYYYDPFDIILICVDIHLCCVFAVTRSCPQEARQLQVPSSTTDTNSSKDFCVSLPDVAAGSASAKFLVRSDDACKLLRGGHTGAFPPTKRGVRGLLVIHILPCPWTGFHRVVGIVQGN